MQIAEADALIRTCHCNAERFIAALSTLGQADLDEIFQDGAAESTCEFCGTTYVARREDLPVREPLSG